jgi:adenosylcobinamide amidohydrolase
LSISLEPPWLVVRFAGEQEVLSWAIVNGGRRRAAAVAWLEVRNADLPVDVDPRALLQRRLQARGLGGAVGLLTSRRIDRFTEASASADGVTAQAVATVGLTNALRVGDPPGLGPVAGTVNVLCHVSARLSEEAALEALAIAAEARTAAVREAGIASRRSGQVATGTGTDCLVLASSPLGQEQGYAGKHTAIGHVIGRAVGDAVHAGAEAWLAEHGRPSW